MSAPERSPKDEARASPAGIVPDLGDALYALALGQAGDLLHQGGLVDLVWELGDDYLFAPCPGLLFYGGLGSHYYAALASGVCIVDALAAHDGRPCGEIGPGQDGRGHQPGANGELDEVYQGDH